MKKHFLMLGALSVLFYGMAADAGSAPVIESFDSPGAIRFNKVAGATGYRVEWAPSAYGPWTNFSAAAQALDDIPATDEETITVSVPMVYRIVAVVPALENMALIPGGVEYVENPRESDESYSSFYPESYTLEVDAFYMDQHLVTLKLWNEVREWGFTNGYTDLLDGQGQGDNHPAHTVSWFDAVKWLNARSERAGLVPVYYVDAAFDTVYREGQIWSPFVKSEANGYRLPTLVEWEYAARGGLENKRFPWGNEINHDHANYWGGASGQDYDTGDGLYYEDGNTTSVDHFAPNGYGLHDMAGNLWEWNYDWFPGEDAAKRAVRGGDWHSPANDCRVGSRYHMLPQYNGDGLGFRAVLPAGQW